MAKKIDVNISILLFVYITMAVSLIYTHCPVFKIGVLFLYLFCFYIIGACLLIPTQLKQLLLPLTHVALSVFIGSMACSLLLLLTADTSFLLAAIILVAASLLFLFKKETSWALKPGMPDIVAFSVAIAIILIISQRADLSRQFMGVQDGSLCYSVDDYFYTSLVTTLRHGSIFNAAYEVNSPLNYQILGFFMPSLLANILGVSSHQALWGLVLPFYKLLAIVLGYDVCYYYLKDKVSRTNYWFLGLSMALPILMAPLHPLYVFKGVVKNFIFNGIGYLVPAGTIGYPATIILLLLCILLFSKIDWKDKKISSDKIYFAVFASLMMMGKVTLFLIFMLFVGSIVLKRLIYNKERVTNYLGYFLITLISSLCLYKICYCQFSGGKSYFEYGYLTGHFGAMFGRSSHGLINNIIVLGLILCLFVVWAGVRVLGLAELYRSKNGILNEFLIGTIASLSGAMLVASFLHMGVYDGQGRLLVDGTFDVEQFLRSAFYLITVVSTIGVLYLLFSDLPRGKFRFVLFSILGVWCCLSLTTISYNKMCKQADCPPNAWYNDNYQLLKTGKFNDGLIVVNPAASSYGIMMASSDYGKYWTAMGRPGDNCTIKNAYRWAVVRELLDTPNVNYLTQMKSEGVKYIISTPVDSANFMTISNLYPKNLHKMKETKWIYELD